jgi:hypothetical protein
MIEANDDPDSCSTDMIDNNLLHVRRYMESYLSQPFPPGSRAGLDT